MITFVDGPSRQPNMSPPAANTFFFYGRHFAVRGLVSFFGILELVELSFFLELLPPNIQLPSRHITFLPRCFPFLKRLREVFFAPPVDESQGRNTHP